MEEIIITDILASYSIYSLAIKAYKEWEKLRPCCARVLLVRRQLFNCQRNGKNKKKYANVYRRDTDVFLPGFFLMEWASVNRLEAPLYSIKPDHDTASKITHTSLTMYSSFSTSWFN